MYERTCCFGVVVLLESFVYINRFPSRSYFVVFRMNLRDLPVKLCVRSQREHCPALRKVLLIVGRGVESFLGYRLFLIPTIFDDY